MSSNSKKSGGNTGDAAKTQYEKCLKTVGDKYKTVSYLATGLYGPIFFGMHNQKGYKVVIKFVTLYISHGIKIIARWQKVQGYGENFRNRRANAQTFEEV